MILEEQVLTIEQAKHLQELGLDMSDAAVVSYLTIGETGKKDRVITQLSSDFNESCYSSSDYIYRYTLQEVLDKLPRGNIRYTEDNLYSCYERDEREIYFFVQKELFDNSVNILEAAYKMLCWIIENGYLKEEQK